MEIVTIRGNDLEGWGEKMLPKERLDKRQHNLQLDNGQEKRTKRDPP